MNKIINATFPRSGHRLLLGILSLYFESDLHHCEWYMEPEKRPEVCPETNFVKTHDFELDWPVVDGWKYLVTIRHPLYSVASWRVLDRLLTGDYDCDNVAGKWKTEFWSKFVNKWVLSPVPNRMIVQYESMIEKPKHTFASIIRFVSGVEPNHEKLNGILNRATIHPMPTEVHGWLQWI